MVSTGGMANAYPTCILPRMFQILHDTSTVMSCCSATPGVGSDADPSSAKALKMIDCTSRLYSDVIRSSWISG